MINPLLKLGLVFLASTTIVQAQKMFTEVSKQAGINHQFEVFEGFLGGGACVIDINNDGVVNASDKWKDIHAYKDANGDGYTNIEKYFNNIDPNQKVDWTKLENNTDTLAKLKTLLQ